MAGKEQVLVVKTGKLVDRGDALSTIEEQLKVTPSEVPIQFTIKPLEMREEFSRVIDRMAAAENVQNCPGECD